MKRAAMIFVGMVAGALFMRFLFLLAGAGDSHPGPQFVFLIFGAFVGALIVDFNLKDTP